MKKCTFVYCLAALSLATIVSGCVYAQRSFPLAGRTPSYCGNIKIYGTDNVPFEYEEIASLAHGYDTFWFTPDDCLRQFAAQAQGLGADAVLNFKLEQQAGVTGFILVGNLLGQNSGYLYLTGTAVKIKRP